MFIPIFALILLSLALLVLVYALHEANRLVVSDVVFRHALIRNKVRVLFLSDLHLYRGMPEKRLSALQNQLKDLVRENQFDLVVMTGDTLDHESGLELLPDILACLPEKTPRFKVLGNHDLKMYNLLHMVHPLFRKYDHQRVNLDALKQLLEEYSVRLLRNESVELKIGETSLLITGIEPYNPFPVDIPVTESFHLMLSHYPEAVRDYRGRVDLLLAGHTHGGQLSWFGIPLVTRSKIKGVSARGASVHGTTAMLVSRGVGSSYYIPFRLGSVPEIITLTLEGVYE